MSTILDYLLARTVKLGLDLQLGREKKKTAPLTVFKHPGGHWIKGRLSISSRTPNRYSSVLDKFGFAGLIELCRFGFLTLDLAPKYGMNRLIDSRNCYELIQRDFVIPRNNKTSNHEHIRTIEELVSSDREKYREMILDAAETVLGYFGFDRNIYGNKKNTGASKWRWLQELKQEREEDIMIETM